MDYSRSLTVMGLLIVVSAVLVLYYADKQTVTHTQTRINALRSVSTTRVHGPSSSA